MTTCHILSKNLNLILFFILSLYGCVSTEYSASTHKQDFFIYSTEREVTLGRNLAKKINEEYKISTNPYDIERIDKIADKILAVIERKELNYYFYIILEDEKGKEETNAFSIPGGHVYIFKGLLNLLDKDDDLAFVIAHEVGHIVSRHHIKRLQAAMGYNFLIIASIGVQNDSRFNSGLSFALAQILMGYSREDELNADELAVKYCKDAGFDPLASLGTLEKINQENKKNIQPLSYFQTHPYLSQRVRHIKEILHLPLDVDDYIN
ncbi:MAG: M48 family metalloprotease [Candidatus Omnitrophica bacterium]|jgi:predicted Zn-dependent protease|nr:M48 family metalloprotease [Candidatus Omnitrophota bacterium]